MVPSGATDGGGSTMRRGSTGLDGQARASPTTSPARGIGPSTGSAGVRSPNGNVFKFKSTMGGSSDFQTKASSPVALFSGGSTSLFPSPGSGETRGFGLAGGSKPIRKIAKVPFKVLDAPALQDDFYLNLVDWAANNTLAVGLGSCVYLWSACTSKVTKLHDFGGGDSVTSVCWAGAEGTSMAGNASCNQVAIGTNSGKVLIWDAVKCEQVTELASHSARVGTLAWNSSLVASGSRDRSIYLQDPRIRSVPRSRANSELSASEPRRPWDAAVNMSDLRTVERVAEEFISSTMRESAPSRPGEPEGAMDVDDEDTTVNVADSDGGSASIDTQSTGGGNGGAATNRSGSDGGGSGPAMQGRTFSGSSSHRSRGCLVRTLSAHKQEVCGLKWSFDGRHLASGGNDNKLLVWDSAGGRATTPVCRFSDHTAAVKAVAWSPHQHGLLASGGGTADRHIRFWNSLNSTPLHRVDTGSQVCNLMWSTSVNEIVSTHGYSLNQIIVWKYPSMQKLVTLTGHTYRVLYLAMSPDGQTVVTGAGDETLRFWSVFPGPRGRGTHPGGSSLLPSSPGIR